MLFSKPPPILKAYQKIVTLKRTGANIGAVPTKGAKLYELDEYKSITPNMDLFYLFESKGRLFFEVKSYESGQFLAPNNCIIYIQKDRFLKESENFIKIK
jgi:hypothetical protein